MIKFIRYGFIFCGVVVACILGAIYVQNVRDGRKDTGTINGDFSSVSETIIDRATDRQTFTDVNGTSSLTVDNEPIPLTPLEAMRATNIMRLVRSRNPVPTSDPGEGERYMVEDEWLYSIYISKNGGFLESTILVTLKQDDIERAQEQAEMNLAERLGIERDDFCGYPIQIHAVKKGGSVLVRDYLQCGK